MSELGDERLARRAARGDQRAFEQIYQRYSQPLYRFCLAMLGNPHDAQDALQNTMVKVLRALPGEEREIKLKPWLYRIARNETVEMLRRRRDRPEPELEQAAPSASQIAERAEDRDRLRALLSDLEALPDRQRGALVMRELSGLSFEEIARAFETSPATARQTVYEARLGLRQMEEGREMRCEAVMRALSDADGRQRRRRDLRAHLRQCPACRAFADEIDERRSELAVLAPLPLVASAGILHGVLAGQAQGSAAGAAGAGSTAAGAAGPAAAGKAIATSAIAKSAATVAVVAVAGVSAADRSGLIDIGLPGHRGSDSRAQGAPAGGSKGPSGKAGAAEASNPASGSGSAGDGSKPHAGDRAAGSQGASNSHGATHQPGSGSSGRSAGKGSAGHGAAGQPHGAVRGKGPPGGAGSGPSPKSAHGRSTAAAHRSPKANPPSGGDSRGSAGGKPAARPQPAAERPPVPPKPSSPGPPNPPPANSAPPAGPGSAAADSSSAAEDAPDGEGHPPFQP